MAAQSCLENQRVLTATPHQHFCSGGENIPYFGVGCIERDAICTQGITFAQNPKGDVFVFKDGCIPDSFSPADQTCPGFRPSVIMI
jgi:hypothetical protein